MQTENIIEIASCVFRYPQSERVILDINPLHVREENLSAEEQKAEKLFLGLRSIVGVDENILKNDELKRAELLKDENKLTKDNGRFYNNNYLLSDEISLFILS